MAKKEELPEIPKIDPETALSIGTTVFESYGVNVIAHNGVVLLYDKGRKLEDVLEALECLKGKAKNQDGKNKGG